MQGSFAAAAESQLQQPWVSASCRSLGCCLAVIWLGLQPDEPVSCCRTTVWDSSIVFTKFLEQVCKRSCLVFSHTRDLAAKIDSLCEFRSMFAIQAHHPNQLEHLLLIACLPCTLGGSPPGQARHSWHQLEPAPSRTNQPSTHLQNARKGPLSRQALAGKRALELGSGMGLAGFALALLGCNATLTDVASVLPLLRNNAQANLGPAARTGKILPSHRVRSLQSSFHPAAALVG